MDFWMQCRNTKAVPAKVLKEQKHGLRQLPLIVSNYNTEPLSVSP